MTTTVVAHIHARYPKTPVTRECMTCGAKPLPVLPSLRTSALNPTDTTKEI